MYKTLIKASFFTIVFFLASCGRNDNLHEEMLKDLSTNKGSYFVYNSFDDFMKLRSEIEGEVTPELLKCLSKVRPDYGRDSYGAAKYIAFKGRHFHAYKASTSDGKIEALTPVIKENDSVVGGFSSYYVNCTLWSLNNDAE